MAYQYNETKKCVLYAIDCDYRLIDTAQYYGNENLIGNAITECTVNREELFIVTKIQSGKNIKKSIEDSLKNLKSDYIDLLLIHWPMGNDLEIYKIMEDYYEKGILRAIGLSNFYNIDYEKIINNCIIRPQVIQQELHILYQNKENRKLYIKDNIQIMSWSPFGEGKENIFENPILINIAKNYKKTVAQVILRFLIQNNIIVIPKSSHKNRIKENINIFDFKLSYEDMSVIESMDKNKSLFGWY